MADSLPEDERVRYAAFIRECQEPGHGLFVDRHGTCVYSAKACAMLKKLDGSRPKYRLAVCNDPSRTSSGVSESMGAAAFRDWLDRVRAEEHAYGAGSLIGHFIHPHCLNCRDRGESVRDSVYVREWRGWISRNQGANGLWNRPEEDDFMGWNGLLKMYGSFSCTGTPVPNAETIMRTILRNRSDAKGSFGPGQCTNYNACHLLAHLSADNNLLLCDEVVEAFEWFTACIAARRDPASGFFRRDDIRPDEGGPDAVGTWSASKQTEWIEAYCRHLLHPDRDAPPAAGQGTGLRC